MNPLQFRGIRWSTNVTGTTSEVQRVCTCLHDTDPLDLGSVRPEVLVELARLAEPACPLCLGQGVQTYFIQEAPSFSTTVVSTKILLKAMGLPPTVEGDLEISRVRRGIMFAKNRDLSAWATTTESPTPQTVEAISKRVQCLETFVLDAVRLGATRIRWGTL